MAYEYITFETLIRHTLLDQFEFSAHSFKSITGPYYLNAIGIDFEAPMSDTDVLEDAQVNKAHRVYLAHTHLLSSDNSLDFTDTKIDPREKIASGLVELPIGNPPSVGDIKFLRQIKPKFKAKDINVIALVFAASGIWRIDEIKNGLNLKKFAEAHESFTKVDNNIDFMKNWSARMDFPNYGMEVEKPKMNTGDYKLKMIPSDITVKKVSHHWTEAKSIISFYESHGIMLDWQPYSDFAINPQDIMKETLVLWAKKFMS